MARSKNTIKFSDISTTPIKLKYPVNLDCSNLVSSGITILDGLAGVPTSTGSVSQEILNYKGIKQLYYSNFTTGSYLTTTSSFDNFLQSTAALGTFDADIRYFPTESTSASIRIMSIPKSSYGETISKKSFLITSSLYTIVDDGNGNLKDLGVALSGYTVQGYWQDLYALNYDPQPEIHVGNIIYSHGMIIITNPNYQSIFPYTPIATNNSGSFLSTNSPFTLYPLNNDLARSGYLDTGSILFYGDPNQIQYFITGSNGSVTLNTTNPGTYSALYTVNAIVTGSCNMPLTSNKAQITFYINSPSTTTTTTTTTSTTTTTTTIAPTTSTTTTTTIAPTTSTTTTTTTIAPTTSTTTTTTTVAHTTLASVQLGLISTTICANGYSTVYISPAYTTLQTGITVYVDPGLTTPLTTGYTYIVDATAGAVFHLNPSNGIVGTQVTSC